MPSVFWEKSGNPAMAEIMADARDRITNREPLSDVQKVVLREWSYRARVRLTVLYSAAQEGLLEDEEYAEMQTLKEELDKIEPFI